MRRPREIEVGRAALLWLGVLGAPAAWALQHVAGLTLTAADCREAGAAGAGLRLDAWTLAVGGVAATVAVASLLAAIATWRATRDVDHRAAPPRGRISMLAVIGMTIAPLFIAMIVMSSLGVVALERCVQS